MIRYESYPDYQNCYEYHGNTSVEITRKQDGFAIKRDWILFDSVEEAQEFFMIMVISMRCIMFNKIVEGILDCLFMAMILIISILGTLAFGL